MKKYYVYIGKLDNRVVYVGRGSGDRLWHLNSGCSHVYEANKNHFKGDMKVEVTIFRSDLSREDADILEKELILELKPEWNKTHNNYSYTGHRKTKSKTKPSTSQYLGVSYRHKGVGKGANKMYWRASVEINRKIIEIGHFHTEIAAAVARDRYVINHNLNKYLNFPDQDLNVVLLDGLGYTSLRIGS